MHRKFSNQIRICRSLSERSRCMNCTILEMEVFWDKCELKFSNCLQRILSDFLGHVLLEEFSMLWGRQWNRSWGISCNSTLCNSKLKLHLMESGDGTFCRFSFIFLTNAFLFDLIKWNSCIFLKLNDMLGFWNSSKFKD